MFYVFVDIFKKFWIKMIGNWFNEIMVIRKVVGCGKIDIMGIFFIWI